MDAVPINLGLTSRSAGPATLGVINAAGLFRKQGLEARLVFVPGSANLMKALAREEVHVAYLGSPAVVDAILRGAELAIFAGCINTLYFSLLTRPDITDGQRLRGQAVASSGAGVADALALRMALERVGLRSASDVVRLDLHEEMDRLEALETGRAAGAILAPPHSLQAQREGFNCLVDLGKLGIPFQLGCLATTRHLLSAEREMLVGCLKAFVEGIRFYKTNKDFALQELASFCMIDNTADLEGAYRLFAEFYLQNIPYPTMEGLGTVLGELTVGARGPAGPGPESLVDLSLLKSLEDSGFFREVWGE